MQNPYSTIAAVCTPAGAGGIGIIRISGPDAPEIADKVFRGAEQPSNMAGYTAALGTVWDNKGKALDQCIVLRFRAPKSYTGEEVIELSCHGGSFVMKRVLQAVYDAGAVPAQSGEFTKRAFLNGKLDLAQAEAVMELIAAGGERAREAAMAGQEGVLSKKIAAMRQRLVEVGGDLVAWADYPDDDIPQVDEARLKTVLEDLEKGLSGLIRDFESGKIYRDGVNTVIAGRPNAGKSTLMNLLSGCERSIVTEIAGTTRDIVEERVLVGEVPLVLADTAGIRSTNDPVEAIGVQRALERVQAAELVLAVFDGSEPLLAEDYELITVAKGRPAIAVINKTDLASIADTKLIQQNFQNRVYLSARSGEGIRELSNTIQKVLGADSFVSGSAALCTARQQQAVRRALEAVSGAKDALTSGFTLDAVTVMTEEAVSALLELIGERVSDTLIDSVFSRFCVGK